MIPLIALILIYILSAFFAWLYIKKAYSKGGRWHLLSPGLTEVFIVFFPIANTVIALDNILDPPIRREDKEVTAFDKFFQIKK